MAMFQLGVLESARRLDAYIFDMGTKSWVQNNEIEKVWASLGSCGDPFGSLFA